MFQPWRRPKLGRAFRRWASFLSPAAGPIRSSAIRRPAIRSTPRPYRDTIVWYASIISVAAALDVGVKQRRRNHWDSAIAEVEDALQISPEQLLALRASILGPQGAPVPHTTFATAENESQHPSSEIASLNSALSKIVNESTIVNDLFRTNPPHKTSSLNPSQASPSPNPPIPTFSTSRPAVWSPKKIARVELSVAKLGFSLVKAAPQDPGKKQQAQKLVEDMVFKLQRTRFVHPRDNGNLQRPELPNYERLNKDSSNHHRHELCTSIQNAFKAYLSGKCDNTTMMRYISRALLISPAPPDATIYSILISGFHRCGMPTSANAVIASMRECNMRHNTTSVSAILDHYIRQHSYKPFHHFVRQLQGLEGGLMLVSPRLVENTPDPAALNVRTYTPDPTAPNVRVYNQKFIQKMALNTGLVHKIFFGYLSFNKKDIALAFIEEARQDGLEFDAHFHCSLLQSAYRERSWHEVDNQWHQICAFLRDPYLGWRVTRGQERFAFHYVLKAFRQQGNLNKYKEVLRFAHSRGWSGKALRKPKISIPRILRFSHPSLESRSQWLDELQQGITIIAQVLHILATQLLALCPTEASAATLKIALQPPPPLSGLPAPVVTNRDAAELKHQSEQPVSTPRIKVVYSYRRDNHKSIHQQARQDSPRQLPIRNVIHDSGSKHKPPKKTKEELPWQRSRRARYISHIPRSPSHLHGQIPIHSS